MPPEYQLASYWDDRFKHEQHFEWLGDGSDSILPHLEAYLRSTMIAPHVFPPRLLHIGAGSSTLSERILETYRQVLRDNVDGRLIVNMDFSEVSVRQGEEVEGKRRLESERMQWVQADALKWSDLLTLADGQNAEGYFAIIVDKSTSDAISCADDIPLKSSPDLHPLLRSYVEESILPTGEPMFLHPVGLLALHLASLVRPGGIWISLSYSSSRFAFLDHPVENDMGSIHPGVFWALERVEGVEAPSGQQKTGINAPNVLHQVYIMRRTDAPASARPR
ncbi:hypothetical protein OBBRIDRAFT_796167 [Obba rivulosa]|uniref:Uncharacterized protein n=1 Tax=Obba rivulosa TaxID=1052685 RepID=A0A8E2DHY5_9APHY|nr:hypothetical protein OBBRIDRAFT_796167 [Obba rivulosa]